MTPAPTQHRVPGPSMRPSRREVVRGTAWAAPAVVLSTAAPAAQASLPPVTARHGVFVQVVDADPGNEFETAIGVASYLGAVPNSSGSVSGPPGALAVGSGSFTPGGSLGSQDGLYGGSGLWISAPVGPDGKFVAGTSTLKAGVRIRQSFTVSFPEGWDAYEPINWAPGVRETRTRAGAATGLRESLNGAAYTVSYSQGEVQGNVWTGTLTITLLEPLVVSGPDTPYGQVLTSQSPVFYDVHVLTSFASTVTVESEVIEVQPADPSLAKSTVAIADESAQAVLTAPQFP